MDKQRVLSKIDEINSYLKELREIKPEKFPEYEGEKKRACERLLQLLIEASIDTCSIITAETSLACRQKKKTCSESESHIIRDIRDIEKNEEVQEYTDSQVRHNQ